MWGRAQGRALGDAQQPRALAVAARMWRHSRRSRQGAPCTGRAKLGFITSDE